VCSCGKPKGRPRGGSAGSHGGREYEIGSQGGIEKFRPEIIGISVRNIDDQNMENPRFLLDPVREIVAECRSLSHASIVLGGAGYSIFLESALSFLGADMGIQGEGESVFPSLFSAVRVSALSNSNRFFAE
jgi:hypothetical protein